MEGDGFVRDGDTLSPEAVVRNAIVGALGRHACMENIVINFAMLFKFEKNFRSMTFVENKRKYTVVLNGDETSTITFAKMKGLPSKVTTYKTTFLVTIEETDAADKDIKCVYKVRSRSELRPLDARYKELEKEWGYRVDDFLEKESSAKRARAYPAPVIRDE